MSNNKKAKCVVIDRNISVDDIAEIVSMQKNTIRLNERKDEMDALQVALEGSKIYLDAHGLLDEEG